MDKIRWTATCRDLTGEKFGRLTVTKYAGRGRQQVLLWECACSCGGTTTLPTNELKRAKYPSCGCWMSEAMAKIKTSHGYARRPEYKVWYAMMARCYNPKSPYYMDYGGRGGPWDRHLRALAQLRGGLH